MTITVFALSMLTLFWAGWQWWSPVDSSASGNRPAPAVSHVVSFSLPTAGYTSEVHTMDIADSGVIDPPDYEHTWWIRDRGVAPSSAATDTTYLACHTHSGKSAQVVPCNMVTPDTVLPGSEVQVTTDVEELTYEVIDARTIPRDEFEHDAEIWDVNPGRLVWISCYLEDGRYSDYNFVVIAELT
ncbi:MAG TPA: hypothetical protein GX013_00890 [Propionibacterium sp.]|nr:hypothetical protein [Propionibacterium sp.]